MTLVCAKILAGAHKTSTYRTKKDNTATLVSGYGNQMIFLQS
jgi:hypothetical protein